MASALVANNTYNAESVCDLILVLVRDDVDTVFKAEVEGVGARVGGP